MRRHQSGADESSLELLLDTICNTFGGVLFISILVVLLVNMSSEAVSTTPPDEISQSELIQMETQLQQSQERMQKLRRAIELQKDIEKKFVEPETSDLVREWRQGNQQLSHSVDNKHQILSKISQSQIKINEITNELEQNAEAIARVKQELSSVESLLSSESSARSRSAKLPKVRRSAKREMVFFLRRGRFTAYAKRDSSGNYVPNAADVVEKTDNGRPYIEPKPNSGTLIKVDGRSDDPIARTLSDFNAAQHYVYVFVWPDSFAQFAALKGVMVRKQFEYHLVPVTNEQKVYVGASSSAGEVQ